MRPESAPLREMSDITVDRSYSTIPSVDRYRSDEELSDDLSGGGRGWTLTIFILVSYMTAAMGLAASIFHFIIIFLRIDAYIRSPLKIVFLLYSLAMSFSICLVELEFTDLSKYATFLNSWIIRGFSYVFIGVLIMEEFKEDLVLPYESSILGQYLMVVSYSLICLGLLYAIMVKELQYTPPC